MSDAKRLLYIAQRKLENGASNEDVMTITKKALAALEVVASGEIQDPFAGSLEEFLSEKEANKDSPQEKLEEKLEEESDIPEEDKEKTQEVLKEKISEESEPMKDVTDTPDVVIEEKSDEMKADAKIRELAKAAEERGYPSLASQILMASEFGILDALNTLLQKEYLQRDLYETYDYLIFGPSSVGIREHLREHMEEETEHVRILQRYIVSMGGKPTLERLPVPEINPLSLGGILKKDLELERDAVTSYTTQIKALESDENYTSLRVDLENILVVEQEHTHDLERWIRDYSVVQAATMESEGKISSIQSSLEETTKVRDDIKKMSEEPGIGLAKRTLEDCFWELDSLVKSLQSALNKAKGE